MKNTLKNLLILTCLSTQVFALATNEEAEGEAWRNGFITAYKAMKADSRIQGLLEKEVTLNKFIIFFDLNKDDIAEWDKLMIQMLGYTTSIYEPIRTKNNWIIFASFKDHATAKQELEMLNNKLFKNQNKKLELFENKDGQKFYAAQTLLTEDIAHLESILQEKHKRELDMAIQEKSAELEKNQKIAVVYLDSSTKKRVELPKEEPLPNKQMLRTPPIVQEADTKPSPIKDTSPKKEKETPSIQSSKPKGEIVITAKSAVAYKLKSGGKLEKSIYPESDFEVINVIENKGEKFPYTSMIHDTNGGTYFKIFQKNIFIDASNAEVVK